LTRLLGLPVQRPMTGLVHPSEIVQGIRASHPQGDDMVQFQTFSVAEPFSTAPTPPLLGFRHRPFPRASDQPTLPRARHAVRPVLSPCRVVGTRRPLDLHVANVAGRLGDVHQIFLL
jgi:hypothetical protein